MDSRLIPLAQSCSHWFVVDDTVVMVNLSEWQIRAFCVLVKRKKVGFEESGVTGGRKNGTIREEFLSSVLNLMFEIL